MTIIPFDHWGRLMRPGLLGAIRRWWWRRSTGLSLPDPPPISGSDGAGWTPIRTTRLTADGTFPSKFYAGIQLTTNGTASTTTVRLDSTTGTVVFTYTIEAVTGGTTRLYPMPGMVVLNSTPLAGGTYANGVDVDANVTEAAVLHG